LANYLRGDSILEAYWKSVSMTTEGLFIGEPLARPFPQLEARLENGILTLKANRHTLPFLKERLSSADEQPSALAEAIPSYKAGIFAVESGRPQFIRDITVPLDAKPGDLLAKIP